jgi:hypothetical protein
MLFFKKLSLCSFSFFASLSWAGVTHSLQHTADVIQPGSYLARAQADVILNRGGGLNVSGHFRTGLIEDMLDIEGFIGSGKTDFKIGSLLHFNLLPDIPGQIGLAFLGGFTFISDDYASNKKQSIKALSIGTVLSKKLEMSFGHITPYGGLQLEALFKEKVKDTYPISGILGAEWALTDINNWLFYSDLNLDLRDSVFMIGLGAGYKF